VHRHGTLSAPLLAAALAQLAGCAGGKASSPRPEAPVTFAAADPRACLVAQGTAPAVPAVVQACAEAFVRNNGYTPARAPRDTTLLVRESFEIGSWDLLVDKRRYTVEPKAALTECDASGCIVFFRRFVRSAGCLAVVMSREYDRLHFGRPAEAELVRRFPLSRCF
jgi:hypothetical protein